MSKNEVGGEVAAQNAASKLCLLSSLFSQPGDLILGANEKAGLVGLLDELAFSLTPGAADG